MGKPRVYAGLFFNVLFFVQPSDPVCLDSSDQSTCKTFSW